MGGREENPDSALQSFRDRDKSPQLRREERRFFVAPPSAFSFLFAYLMLADNNS